MGFGFCKSIILSNFLFFFFWLTHFWELFCVVVIKNNSNVIIFAQIFFGWINQNGKHEMTCRKICVRATIHNNQAHKTRTAIVWRNQLRDLNWHFIDPIPNFFLNCDESFSIHWASWPKYDIWAKSWAINQVLKMNYGFPGIF